MKSRSDPVNRRAPQDPFGGPSLELNSDFGSLDGEALLLVERRYADRGLAVTRERFSSRSEAGDLVCTARDGEKIVGTLTVRFDGAGA